VETATGLIKNQGVCVEQDLALLKDVRNKGKIYFTAHEDNEPALHAEMRLSRSPAHDRE
jgi:hypothetical protein